MVMALGNRNPSRAIKVARQDHKCWKCGTIIKQGDRFAMCLDYSTFQSHPTCLKCYTEYRPQDYR